MTTTSLASPPEALMPFGPVLLVTVVYFAVFYAFLFMQSYIKVYLINRSRGTTSLNHSKLRYSDPRVAAVKYGNTENWLALVADRTVGNTLEQQNAFLWSTWLHAIFAGGATVRPALLGYAYIATRVAYPFCFYLGHPYLQMTTTPGYLIILANFTFAVAGAFRV